MQKLSVKEKIGYGLGDTATNLTYRTIMVFLSFFYTDVFGLSAGVVATLFLVSRLWDAVNDPLMGIIADRTHTRWGQFRPWILWSAIPFGLLTFLTFSTPDFGPTGKIIYAYATYILLMMVFTVSNIPYSALSGVMTSDPNERTSLSTFRFVFAFLGALLAQGLNIPLTKFFGQGDQVKGYQWTISIFAVISIILFVITFLSTKERIHPPKAQQGLLKNDVKNLLKNKPWVILFIIGILFVTFSALRQGATLYYFKYFIGDTSTATSFMVTGLIAAMIGAAITNQLSLKIGKKKLFISSTILAGISSTLFFFLQPESRIAIYSLNIIIEFFGGPMPVLFFAMLADSADYSEWVNNRRSTGIIFSAGTFAIKTGGMIAGAGTGFLLSIFGYAANAEQSSTSILGIKLLMSIIPAVIILVGTIFTFIYPLNEQTLLKIESDLAERR